MLEQRYGEFGLTVTSPPYDVGIDYDGIKDKIPDYFEPIRKISKVLILFPGYVQMWTLPRPVITAIWLKENSMTGGACFSRFAVWEPILFYGFWGQKRLYNRDVFDYPISNQSGANGHPCPYPLPLIKTLIQPLKSDIILDPFLGSGTTCVASKNLNRKSIGIEINPKYCEIAVRRLRQEVFDFRKKE